MIHRTLVMRSYSHRDWHEMVYWIADGTESGVRGTIRRPTSEEAWTEWQAVRARLNAASKGESA